MDLALERGDYARLRHEQATRRLSGELVGVGLATYTESAGGGFETGRVILEPDGSVTAVTGGSAFGQGQHTTFCQIVADRLGIDPETVRVGVQSVEPPTTAEQVWRLLQ
jgi:aerobic carbon-monoxide dehydrogenase large subunit